jgi:dolichyl-phosphate beta-glucosyltransferase
MVLIRIDRRRKQAACFILQNNEDLICIINGDMLHSQAAIPSRVCLVIPCYNEADRLDIHAFRDYFASHVRARFVFVDDGSRDNTAAVLKDLCEGYEDRAAHLSYQPNVGKAEAVRRGILFALNEYDLDAIGFWDADLATPLHAIPGFINVMTRLQNIDMIVGSRVQLLGRHIHRSATRHYLGRVFATVASITLRLPIYDTQCGAKLFRINDEMKQVFSEPFLSKWVFDVEILARYSKLCGHDPHHMQDRIYEFTLEHWRDVAGSKVRPRDFFLAMLDLARIRVRYF